jgi:hypothetical protein
MFLLYHSEGCNICEMVLYECYVNDLHTTTCSGMLGHHSCGGHDGCLPEGTHDAKIVERLPKRWAQSIPLRQPPLLHPSSLNAEGA